MFCNRGEALTLTDKIIKFLAVIYAIIKKRKLILRGCS